MSSTPTEARRPTGERGQFSSNPLHSPTLPSRYYTDPQLHRLELEHIFYRSWCYVGHVSELPSPGSYLVEHIADQPIFVVRTQDDDFRGFYNVCQHRGHELLHGCGRLRAGIRCPYHGWTYSLDGALVSARLTDRMEQFEPSEFSLRPIAVIQRAGLLFASMNVDADPRDANMDSLEATILDHLSAAQSFQIARRYDFDIAANWKVVVDNFSEGYHIPVAHPKLSKVLEQSVGESIVERRFARFKSRSRAGFEGYEIEPGQPYLSWTVWPNLCMLSQPGCENLIVLRMAPNGSRHCAERVDLLAPQGSTDPKLEAIQALFAENFNLEDIAIVESVQRGLESRGYDQGRYVADHTEQWYSEAALHRFHSQILEALEAADADPR